MNDEIREQIWHLCQYLQVDLTPFSDDDLAAMFQRAFSLQMMMQHVEAEPVEKQVISDCVKRLHKEVRRRGLKIKSLPVEVAIDVNGNFIKGREELRSMFSILSFEEMIDFIDSILAHPLNDAQRMALLDLAYEKVYAERTDY